jgi:hypothetical protein
VVHLPVGTYLINTTLTIPAGSDVQLVGDGDGDAYATTLKWNGSGSGPVLHIMGPSKATLQDLSVFGNGTAEGIVADGIDQSGARVFMHQPELRSGTQANLLVDGLDYTNVDLRNLTSDYMNSGVSVKVVGGPLAAAGDPVGGKTNIFAGDQSVHPLNCEVMNGGRLLVRDVWYETLYTSGSPAFVRLASTTGTFTIEGSRIALPANQPTPAIAIHGFQGKASFLTTRLDDRIVISGDGSQTKVLGLGMVGTNNSSNSVPDYFLNNSSPTAQAAVLNSRQITDTVPGSGSVQFANEGTEDPTFIKDMVAHTRGEHPKILTSLPSGVTDLRLFRVWVGNAPVGIHLLP